MNVERKLVTSDNGRCVYPVLMRSPGWYTNRVYRNIGDAISYDRFMGYVWDDRGAELVNCHCIGWRGADGKLNFESPPDLHSLPERPVAIRFLCI